MPNFGGGQADIGERQVRLHLGTEAYLIENGQGGAG